jgi:hypothetical protein
MKIAISFLILIFSSILYGQQYNVDLPNKDIGTGPSVAYIYSDHKKGYSINYDTSYTYKFFASSVNLKYMNIGGTKNYGFQTEFTFWFLANIGGGAGYLFGDKSAPIYHGFIGVPFGDDDFKHGPFHSYYIEPYYRLNYFNKKFIHEAGIMFKITTYTI